MKIGYSAAFMEQALIKVYSRGERTVNSVAVELNINPHTLKNWMKRRQTIAAGLTPKKERRPQDWSTEQQLMALHETHALSGESLQTWCRENGLFPHHLASWKAVFCNDAKTATGNREIRALKAENDRLKRELTRKEQALAEAAALLVLQKKFRALWEEEVK